MMSIKNPLFGRKFKNEEVINEFKNLIYRSPDIMKKNELISITVKH